MILPVPRPDSLDGSGGRAEAELVRVLRAIQDRGAIGRGPIEDAVDHARDFVRALPWPEPGAPMSLAVVDLGSGGGLPGLVVAHDRADLRVTLVERRAKRADLLSYGVRSLGLGDRTEVMCADVAALIRAQPSSFDLVTARAFAAPQVVFEVASALLRPGGWILLSEPPDDAPRWTGGQLDGFGLVDDGRHGRVRRLHRRPPDQA